VRGGRWNHRRRDCGSRHQVGVMMIRSSLREMVKLECLQCGQTVNTFPSRVGRKKFCSRRCAGLFHAEELRTRNRERGSSWLTVVCAFCGQSFMRTEKRASIFNRQYCSYPCKASDQLRHVTRTCEVCGVTFEVHPSDLLKSKGAGHFCSKRCRGVWIGKHQIGEKNPSWNGGISPLIKVLRETA
jgi:endogenous inhibitor of DNA gyrase (YacG/DUF329 family)